MLERHLQQKLRDLIAAEGLYGPEDFIDVNSITGAESAYAICVNEGCTYTERIPIDEPTGFCEVCDRDSLMNAVIAANCGWCP